MISANYFQGKDGKRYAFSNISIPDETTANMPEKEGTLYEIEACNESDLELIRFKAVEFASGEVCFGIDGQTLVPAVVIGNTLYYADDPTAKELTKLLANSNSVLVPHSFLDLVLSALTNYNSAIQAAARKNL